MGIFKPRAPKPAPAGATLRFNFAGDRRIAEERERALHGMPVDDAITRLQIELRKRRQTLHHIEQADQGKGQHYAAMTGDEMIANFEVANLYRSSPEGRKRIAAEAQAEIDRILGAVV